jgi:hypothetical protein
MDRSAPDNTLACIFPTLRFNVMHSLSLDGHWFIYVNDQDRGFVGTFWDPKEGFPSDELIAKLALVA